MPDDEYDPANRPPGDIPGGDRVRFEHEGEHEQSLFGGGAQDIEASVLKSTERNLEIIGWVITGVSDTVGDLGAGTMQSMTLILNHIDGRQKMVEIRGIALEVEIVK